MSEVAVVVIGLLVFGWAIFSGALARHNITGPLLFATAGYVLANPDWGVVSVHVDTVSVHVIAEVTLALVLFSDAARINVHELRHDVSVPVRLLAIGLPLSVLIGTALAGRLIAGLPWALAGFLGAALAPTDAALSVQVIDDERIPMRLRRALNVESGLNDGIVTPIVTVMLAVAASQLGVVEGSSTYEAGVALRELAVGLAIGLVSGVVGAVLITVAVRRSWIETDARQLAALAVAVVAFAAALAVDANGFIAAFVAGIAFGATITRRWHDGDSEHAEDLPQLSGELMALVVWFLFGATLLPIAFETFDLSIAVYALVSLTIVRVVPVALALFRSELDRPSITFVAWFGPRGLASVVFALLAIEELGETSAVADRAVGAVALTVMMSVLLHGATAGPGGRIYVEHTAAATTAAAAPEQR